ncbi:TniB family NTP-binding protein [Curvibacter sp. HBC28]|uniref:TniB family NTP-binding protein n=1 Tax=Curvibacter microcysteis TaxID=3026419 RepID=A0ABT5MDY1_9BURK|nr:TniB family NTP-binding protein [Curvibacter sp. HBC28]MDD0813375.1 TniB family NTP-binding protein [Curvibacter sp. HBC28]
MNKELNSYSGHRSPEVLKVGEQILNVVVDHQVFRRIRDACRDLIHTMRTLRTPSGILILSEPGMGKTLLLDLIDREFSKAAQLEGNCLQIALDDAVDQRGIASAMTLALGYPALPSRPTLVALNHMVSIGLQRRRAAALLIDEMQHVCEGHKDITARAATDWLKVRMDMFNLPVIGAGTRALERLALINPQFVSRASAAYVIHPFDLDEQWRQLLAAFSHAVQAVDLGIVNTSACRALHVATGGNMRTLKRLLMYACMHAATQPQKIVTLESLSKGLRDVKGDVSSANDPFQRSR